MSAYRDSSDMPCHWHYTNRSRASRQLTKSALAGLPESFLVYPTCLQSLETTLTALQALVMSSSCLQLLCLTNLLCSVCIFPLLKVFLCESLTILRTESQNRIMQGQEADASRALPREANFWRPSDDYSSHNSS